MDVTLPLSNLWIPEEMMDRVRYYGAFLKAETEGPTWIDRIGYWPFIGSLVGLLRICYGLIIVLASLLFTCSVDGWQQIPRGMVELIPCVGGFLLHRRDEARYQEVLSTSVRTILANLGDNPDKTMNIINQLEDLRDGI